jgi:hypothetical protein
MAEDPGLDEEEHDTDDEAASEGGWETYPWRRAVAACSERDDLDSWPCPACKHPLAFHAVHGSTTTSAFARNHGQDYRFSCDAWLFIGDGVGALAEPGDGHGSCPCEFHGIVGGAPWPAEYRPLYLYLDPNPQTFNTCEPSVEMRGEDWRPYEPVSLDRWLQTPTA